MRRRGLRVGRRPYANRAGPDCVTTPVLSPVYLRSMHTSPVGSSLSSIVVGLEVAHGELVMIPLMGRTGRRLEPTGREQPLPWNYDVLDDAIASGDVEVTEVSEKGSVPELTVRNRGPRPALIVDGEELVGAKQNRVINLTILVPPASELTIPVSCVEAGRWRARSRAFASAPRTQYAAGRARRMAQVTQSIQSSGLYASDQAEVWSDIARKASRVMSVSPTGAMEAIFVGHAAFLDACVTALRPIDGQVGAAFAIRGRVIGFDLFDSERTLRKLLPKLVRSVAVDAVDADMSLTSSNVGPAPLRRQCEHFLVAVTAASTHTTPALGLGDDVRVTAHGLTGAALIVEQQVVHLSAFTM